MGAFAHWNAIGLAIGTGLDASADKGQTFCSTLGPVHGTRKERAVNYSAIKYCDIANGEGVRTSLFVSGCRRGCPFCFNEEAQDFASGEPFDAEAEEAILKSLKPEYVDGLTLLGGEPMEPENQAGLVDFVERVKARFPEKAVWCYTGDVLEELMPGGRHHTEVTDRLLGAIDILVDGPFIQAQKDITLRFRGSANQRIIDMNATRAAAAEQGVPLNEAVRIWRDDPVFSTHTME